MPTYKVQILKAYFEIATGISNTHLYYS